MVDDHGLSDLRFPGYSNHDLADQVDKLRGGSGAQSLHDAAHALAKLALSLSTTDRELRKQLQEIGVSWQGQAADGGVRATQAAAVHADDSANIVSGSASGVATQGGSFTHARDSAPDANALRGPTCLNGIDQFAGLLGHTTDHAKDVKATNDARARAVSGLNGYQNSSSGALGQAGTLPVPPGIGLIAGPSDTATHVSSVGGPSVGGGAFQPGSPGAPGASGSFPGVPGGGGPGVGPYLPGGGAGGPGAGGPGAGGLPGFNTGVGPVTPTVEGLPGVPGGSGGLSRPVPSLLAADAAALAAAGGAGAGLGASAEEERLVRGRQGAQGNPQAKPGHGAQAKPGAGAAAGAVSEEEARSVRNAERFGARQGRVGGGALMQPAVASARDEEDASHVRKYGIDSGDVFEDDRLISPALIGEDGAESPRQAD